ncbi:MAG: M28 family peptidase [Bacteroidetes bacterium]|nr:MAG: M28 family peptidase [Bacteroidota bacterium]
MASKLNSMKKWLLATFSVALLSPCAFAQSGDIHSARADLYFLASDSLKGRSPGSREIIVAANHIVNVFKDAELAPLGEENYFQAFPIPIAMTMMPESNQLQIGDAEYHPSKTIFPVRFSENATAKGEAVHVGFGITAPELEHDDYNEVLVEGKIAIIDISSPDGIHPHSQYMKYHGLDYRISNAKEHGAVGVVFTQTDRTAQPPQSSYNSSIPSGLPAWFMADAKDIVNGSEVSISVQLLPAQVMGYNVIGYADRGMESTIIIGAHYDHLGYGGENSLYRGESAIHNGADDNASGTTGLLYLARNSASIAPDHNLLFIAFSGEERGLIGSDYYSEHPTVDLSKVVAMLNMDMIGRLSEDRELLISGTGTAVEWDDIIEGENTTSLAISSSKGGTGASDHTSFYQKNIPVLHFFTGTHDDYHKPSDDPDKINYEGLIEVADYIERIANAIPDELTFQKTNDAEQSTTPRFNVTLGIIPDYIFGGPGVKVDGVTDGKPAAKAGLLPDDIITQLGEYPIADIYAYMRALGAFKPGDSTTVKVLREEKEMEFELTF